MNNKVRLKFECTSKRNTGQEVELSFWPVVSGSEENKSFWKYTPNGELTFSTSNIEAGNQFEIGNEYFIDIIPAGGEKE